MNRLRLASLFTDHLVLQRNRENPIWGWDEPGQRIVLSIEGHKASFSPIVTAADSEGRFSVNLPVMGTGGPYRIRVEGSGEIALTDVMVGEVWLSSGQSPFACLVNSVQNAADEIHASHFPGIRMFLVDRQTSTVAEERVSGRWVQCHPSRVGGFPAAAYFFARQLHQRLGVPCGIIDVSFDGTDIESWISLEALRPVMPELACELANVARQRPRVEEIRDAYYEQVRAWERNSLPADPGNLGMLDGWANTDFDDSHWKEMHLPRFWQSDGLDFNGVVWFRKTIEVPKSWAGKELRLLLGAIEDFDQTYFNGVLIGEHPDGTPEAHRIQREYQVPGYLVRPGRNVLSVRVFDHGGNGGFRGPATDMLVAKAEGTSRAITLAGPWKYEVELEIPRVPPNVLRSIPAPPKLLVEQQLPAALYHGMVAPLLPYGISGILFCHGQGNTDDHRHYRERMVALVRDWRTRFGQGTLPVVFAQQPSFSGNASSPFFREAQHQVCFEPRCFMVPTIDLGEPDESRPCNIQAISARLARIALSCCYGEGPAGCSYPEFQFYEPEGERARLHFKNAEGLHTSDGQPSIVGFAVCGMDGVFRKADASIDGSTVIVRSPYLSQIRAVRYGFSDDVTGNLVNAEELPLLPFRTDGAGRRV